MGMSAGFVAMNAASPVDELKPVENAGQDASRAALCEGGLVEELAHVDLAQLEHEADVDRPVPGLALRLLQSWLSLGRQLPEQARDY
eukprot:5228669-Pyramimonas_sp.AAC.1